MMASFGNLYCWLHFVDRTENRQRLAKLKYRERFGRGCTPSTLTCHPGAWTGSECCYNEQIYKGALCFGAASFLSNRRPESSSSSSSPPHFLRIPCANDFCRDPHISLPVLQGKLLLFVLLTLMYPSLGGHVPQRPVFL